MLYYLLFEIWKGDFLGKTSNTGRRHALSGLVLCNPRSCLFGIKKFGAARERLHVQKAGPYFQFPIWFFNANAADAGAGLRYPVGFPGYLP